MSIDVILEKNPRGEDIASIGIEGFWRDGLPPKSDDQSFCLPKYIGPYGSTFFNRLQIPDLMEEWKRLYEGAESSEQLDFLRRVEGLVTSHGSGPYLHFWGD